MRSSHKILTGLIAATAGLVLAQGAQANSSLSRPADGSQALGQIADPLEGWNRGVYGFNRGLDRAIIRPAAMGYRRILPGQAREGVHNALGNLGSPVLFLNDLMQVRPTAASQTAVRFVVNSTVGVLGVFDVASIMGVYRHRADFGQTLGHYGVGTGAYIYLPVFGPSSVRDTVGLVVNMALDPINYARFNGDVATKVAVITLNALDTRLALDKDLTDLDRSATDPYVSTRSIWVQNRAAFVRGDKPVDVDALPDFDSSTSNAPVAAPGKPK